MNPYESGDQKVIPAVLLYAFCGDQVLMIQKNNLFTQHLEVETYTWEVLPQHLKLPIGESICRELKWVQQILD